MALFACHDDWRLNSLSARNTPMVHVLDTTRNNILYELLARNDESLKIVELLSLTVLASTLSLCPGSQGGGERPGTHCLHMHLIYQHSSNSVIL